MRVTNKSDFPVTDAACKKATGKTLKQWFTELDGIDGLGKGRRASTQHIYAEVPDAWWPTTIYVAYEAHHGVTKKDGLGEGYSICATKTIKAPVAKVYETWTDPGVRTGGRRAAASSCSGIARVLLSRQTAWAPGMAWCAPRQVRDRASKRQVQPLDVRGVERDGIFGPCQRGAELLRRPDHRAPRGACAVCC